MSNVVLREGAPVASDPSIAPLCERARAQLPQGTIQEETVSDRTANPHRVDAVDPGSTGGLYRVVRATPATFAP
jgi:hypothetical protein